MVSIVYVFSLCVFYSGYNVLLLKQLEINHKYKPHDEL